MVSELLDVTTRGACVVVIQTPAGPVAVGPLFNESTAVELAELAQQRGATAELTMPIRSVSAYREES